MKKLGTWLGIVALALQMAWPLLANAKPSSVVLVPLCTVDGVTHYLEVPTGKTPLEESVSHGEHCPLCFIGHADAVLPQGEAVAALSDADAAAGIAATPPHCPKPAFFTRGARAPPFFRAVTSADHELGRYDDETASLVGRSAARTADGSRFLRLGLLHDQH